MSNYHDVHKVGVLPYRKNARGEMEYLIYQPLAKNPDETEILPFQLARGTIEEPERDDHLTAAKREASEELAVLRAHVASGQAWRDAGVHCYKDYNIHFFTVEVKKGALLSQRPEDAQATMWATRDAIARMAAQGTFKNSYVPLLDTLVHHIDCHAAVSASRGEFSK